MLINVSEPDGSHERQSIVTVPPTQDVYRLPLVGPQHSPVNLGLGINKGQEESIGGG